MSSSENSTVLKQKGRAGGFVSNEYSTTMVLQKMSYGFGFTVFTIFVNFIAKRIAIQ